MHYLLFDEVGDDYVSKRAQFRGLHLEKAWAAIERGELNPGRCAGESSRRRRVAVQGRDSPEVAEKFARFDPYVVSGAVKRWYVREWASVAGENAATPIRPNVAATSDTTLQSMRQNRYKISKTSYFTPSDCLSPTATLTILFNHAYFGEDVSKNGAVRK